VKKGKGKGIFGRVIDYTGTEVDAETFQPITPLPASTIVERQLGRGGGAYKGACKPNILIFAKGTTETGEMGITVGPAIKTAIQSKGGANWAVVGVNYNANSDGNYCVGLPGGMVAKDILESAAAKCPSSKIFLSGYSQGAMVVRNAVAYSNEQARSQVKVRDNPFHGKSNKSPYANIYIRVSLHMEIHSTVHKSRDGLVLSKLSVVPLMLSALVNSRLELLTWLTLEALMFPTVPLGWFNSLAPLRCYYNIRCT
jgi:hypothetical protein